MENKTNVATLEKPEQEAEKIGTTKRTQSNKPKSAENTRNPVKVAKAATPEEARRNETRQERRDMPRSTNLVLHTKNPNCETINTYLTVLFREGKDFIENYTHHSQ